MRQVTIAPLGSSGLRSLIVTPESSHDTAPALLFLHGMKEAGSSPNELPKVCIHQSPPWQAIVGHLPDAFVVAPQAPALPDERTWNWRDHIDRIAESMRGMFPGRRMLATGFSRGGLGVLQLLAIDQNLFERWAVIDPQPPRDQQEAATLRAAASTRPGWVRYGVYRHRSAAWTQFADALDELVLEQNRDVTPFDHGELALRAYADERLSSPPKPTLYEFLQLRF
jgi:hypothetical protein